MLDGWKELFLSDLFMPHGMCLLWRPDLLALHGLSDVMIALAYFTIPLVILRAARRRPDLVDAKVARLFAAFITACALSHLAGLVTLWLPIYGLQGLIKAATAVVSVYTAVELARLLPAFLTMPSRADLAARDEALQSSRVESRRVREANDKLTEFAHIASHDLRAPMRGIANHARFLAEDHGAHLPEDAQRRLTRMQDLCRQMEHLIVTLLDFSRIGRDESDGTVDLAAVVDELRDQMAETLAEKGASLVIDTPLPMVRGSAAGLSTVLGNLVANGLTYNRSDTPAVHIGHLDRVEQGGRWLRDVIYVRDNGIGIPEAQQEQVFRMFKRLHQPEEFGPGTGAGLAFVRRVVESIGGQVVLKSAPGEGATFYIVLRPEPAESTDAGAMPGLAQGA